MATQTDKTIWLGGVRRIISRLAAALARTLSPGPAFRGGGGTCVALVDTDGTILALSGSAPSMFQNADGAKTLSDLFLPDERAGVDRAVRSKAVNRIEARGRRSGGEAGFFELAFQRRPDGRANVLIVDRTSARAELDARARAAEKASEDARASAARLADLSHEMRTPLNAVIGFADTMGAETFGPLGHEKYAEYAEHIRGAGGHLLDLVNAILDLAKIDADRFALQKVKADPAEIGRACAEMVRLSAEKAGLKLITRIDDDLPESFLDPRALRQILINLLSNAVKFTSDGEVSLSAARDGDDIVFTVADTGVGMSEAELASLGARFTAAQGAGVRGADGAGLGLALAFALADLHGGSLTIDSAPGEGVTAIVRLPIAAPARPSRERGEKACASSDDDAGATSRAGEKPSVNGEDTGAVLTQLERIEAYRREVAEARTATAA